MAKVSVIIPTYNRADFISETIESVLNQTFKDLEIIVVDDGSKDNTKNELKKFNSKIRYIKQENLERAIARNKGVEASNGEYIAFLDSDDLWLPYKLEKQIEVLDNRKDLILAYSQSLRIDQHGKKIKTAKRQLEGFSGNVFEKLLLRNFIVSATPMIKRKYFEKLHGFETKYIPYEDWEFWIRLSLLGNFYFVKSPLAYYRVHKNQSVKNTTADKIESVTTLLLENSFKLKPIKENLRRKSLGLANLRFCYWYLCADNIIKAKEKNQKAIELFPDFIFNPRWHGLNLLCRFPSLKDKWVFDLEQYH